MARNAWGEWDLIPNVAKIKLKYTTGGWNILHAVQHGIADFVAKDIIRFWASGGGQIEVQDVPFWSQIPFVGLLFVGAQPCGDMIDPFGNGYDDQGNIIDNINYSAPPSWANTPSGGTKLGNEGGGGGW